MLRFRETAQGGQDLQSIKCERQTETGKFAGAGAPAHPGRLRRCPYGQQWEVSTAGPSLPLLPGSSEWRVAPLLRECKPLPFSTAGQRKEKQAFIFKNPCLPPAGSSHVPFPRRWKSTGNPEGAPFLAMNWFSALSARER